MFDKITTLDGSGTETIENPATHVKDWHGVEPGGYSEDDLAAVHVRLHRNPEEPYVEEAFHVHPEV